MKSAFAGLGAGKVRPETLEALAAEVREVETELLAQVHSQVKLVGDVGAHTLRSGGKRLRPAFVSLAAWATGLPHDSDRSRKLGACMEMIHMATLIHDDVIDHSPTRRGQATASAVFGNTAAILSGDVLLAKAMAILAQDGDLEIIRTVSAAVVDLAEGEVLELQTRGQFDLHETEHFEILRMKTATFIAACCEVGALVTCAPHEQREALGRYGYHIGIAFQVADDLLDYRGDSAKTGKAVATDFREGCATLPLIALRDALTAAEREVVARKFGNGVTDDEIRMICNWMDSRGAFAKAEQTARHHVEQAHLALETLSPSPERDLLATVADYVVQRQA